MNGKTHKVVGIAAGISCAIYGSLTGTPLLALAVITAPIGAMLPDIDHNHSAVGRVRKKTFFWLELAVWLFVLFVAASYIGYGWFLGDATLYLGNALLVAAPMCVCGMIAWLPAVRKRFRFFTKHRGIMHTLFVPGCLVGLVFLIKDQTAEMLLVGTAAGYLSHLAADMLTETGCPILFPFTQKAISLMPVRTNTAAEYMLATILILLILCCPFLAAR
jgi:membrane-bound metal-dependent hydrolase YbcI (DUF457 family)